MPGEHDLIEVGSSAGFYVDATAEPWSNHYNMETYITEELSLLVFRKFPQLDSSRVGICGHSMGGHGALTLYFKHPEKYKSLSALSPLCSPIHSPIGEKAFLEYFKSKEEWFQHDSIELIKKYKGPELHILFSIGTEDQFKKILNLENFVQVAAAFGYEKQIEVITFDGYDHFYLYVSTVAQYHVEHAAKYLFA